MGLLTVLLDHGKDLMAADRNGYSDPYAQFVLNEAKVFKSSVQKKTLNPKWTERFDVEIVRLFLPVVSYLGINPVLTFFDLIAIKSRCRVLGTCLRLG